MSRFVWLISLLLLLCSFVSQAQEIVVRSDFHRDSLRIGDIVPYSLTATYPAELNIIFPDSSGQFEPFEYDHKRFFQTRTNDGTSYDSVVYYLTTFEVDSIQSLALPVFVVHQNDCTRIDSEIQSIRLQSLVTNVPDSVAVKDLPLRFTLAHEPVGKQFNYLIAGGILIVILVIGLVVWLVFGKRIRKHFALKRLRKNHQRFITGYNEVLQTVTRDRSVTSAEHTIALWKEYLEKLENRPYTKLTSKETFRYIQDDRIKSSLRGIDRMLYANDSADVQPFEQLKVYAEEAFQKKVKEVAHG